MPFIDPALPLQKALVAKLTADPTITGMVGTRVYDAVPMDATKPYVSFGPFQMLPEHGDCLDGGETFIQLDAWARGPDTVEAKRLGAAIAICLDETALTLDNNRLVLLEIDQTQYLRDPDGITAHCVVSLRALTDPLDDGSSGDITPPTITSSAAISVNENAVLAHTLTADEAVTWAKVGGADASKVEIVGGNLLRWPANITRNFEIPADSNGDNVYMVTLRARDASGNDSFQNLSITVLDVVETIPGGAGTPIGLLLALTQSTGGAVVGDDAGEANGLLLALTKAS